MNASRKSAARCFWRAICLLLLLTCTPTFAIDDPVGRASGDRESDLISALLSANRFEDAIKVCSRHLRGADPERDAIAKWSIEHCRVLVAQQMATNSFNDRELAQVQSPTNTLLKSYPNHPRTLFLEAENTAALRQAARHTVLKASINSGDAALNDRAVRRLLHGTEQTKLLAKRIAEQRSVLDTRSPRPYGLVSDLLRLEQEQTVAAVSLALMQTELAPPASVDQIAAANQAEKAAQNAIARLPVGTTARREVERLRVEAILRSGQKDRAESEFPKMARAYGSRPPAVVVALQVRLDIEQQRYGIAQKRLASFYGSDPSKAPTSIEMDLAQLRFLMRNPSQGNVGQWLDVIEQRGGAFARRRAEAISLASVRSTDRESPESIDPSIIAAQGQQWLRRGDAERAGRLLAAAAVAERDPDRAVQRSSEAAAVMLSAKQPDQAAQLLAEISVRNKVAEKASAAHLQAAVIMASNSGAATQIQQILRDHLSLWPEQESANSARSWLIRILESQQRLVEAAEAATMLSSEHANDDQIQLAISKWNLAFRESNDRKTLSSRFVQAFEPLIENESVETQFALAAAMIVDRQTLNQIKSSHENAEPTFLSEMFAFRTADQSHPAVRLPPQELAPNAIQILMADGQIETSRRLSIANLIESWKMGDTDPLDQAERLLWQNRTGEAIGLVTNLVGKDAATDTLKRAARFLGVSSEVPARELSIELWDRLAAGSQPGSTTWHEAKLGAIRLLSKSGQTEASSKRAKYVLLTRKDLSVDLLKQYQAYVR